MSAVIGTAVRLRADAARNLRLVLDAAARLFAERGLDVSMHEIAEAAGVGVGTVFRRVHSKEHLITLLVQQQVEEICGFARAALERVDREPWDAFAEYVVRGTELQVRHRAFMEAASSDGCCAMVETVRPLIEVTDELVERAQATGAVRADATGGDVLLLQALASRSVCHPIAAAEPEVWRRACLLMLDGLRADGPHEPLAPAMPTFAQTQAAFDEA